MELSKVAQKVANSPIPEIGIVSRPESVGENEGKYSSTAVCAYYKAEVRGFESGHEIEDWLAAEAEENQ